MNGQHWVIISANYPPLLGGVSDYAENLVKALIGAGMECSVITAGGSRTMASYPVIDIAEHGLSWGLRDANRLAVLIARLSPDVVCLQYVPYLYGRKGIAPGIAWLPFALRRSHRCTMLCTLHELGGQFEGTLQQKALDAAHQLQLRVLVKPFARTIVTNPWDEDRIRHLAPSKPVTRLPVGSTVPQVPCDQNHRSQLRSKLGARKGDLLLADFSPFHGAKNPEILAEVLEAVPETRLLLIVGVHAHPKLRQRFWLRANGLTERIIEIPHLDRRALSLHLQAADLYLHTAVVPGASTRSTTLATALAHGLPTVAFQGRETPPEFLGEHGIALVEQAPEPTPWSQFVKKVRELRQSSQYRAAMSRAARDTHQRLLSWEAIAGSYIQIA